MGERGGRGEKEVEGDKKVGEIGIEEARKVSKNEWEKRCRE